MTPPKIPRRWVFLILGILVSIALGYLSFRKVEFSELSKHIASVSVSILALALVTQFTNFCLVALRSSLLFAPLHRYSFWFLFKSGLLAFAVNNVVPFRAGEVARIGYLARESKLPASSCLAVVAVERLLDLVAVCTIILCTLPAMAVDLPLGAPFYAGAALIVAFISGAIWISKRPEKFVEMATWMAGLLGRSVRAFVKSKSKTFAHGLSALASPTTVIAVILITLIFWLLGALSIQIWIWAFGFVLPWYSPIVVLTFLTFGLAIPSTPGHLGSFHFFAASAMISLGVSNTESVSFAIVGHAMAVLPFTLLALPVLLRDFIKMRAE